MVPSHVRRNDLRISFWSASRLIPHCSVHCNTCKANSYSRTFLVRRRGICDWSFLLKGHGSVKYLLQIKADLYAYAQRNTSITVTVSFKKYISYVFLSVSFFGKF